MYGKFIRVAGDGALPRPSHVNLQLLLNLVPGGVIVDVINSIRPPVGAGDALRQEDFSLNAGHVRNAAFIIDGHGQLVVNVGFAGHLPADGHLLPAEILRHIAPQVPGLEGLIGFCGFAQVLLLVEGGAALRQTVRADLRIAPVRAAFDRRDFAADVAGDVVLVQAAGADP